MKKNLYAGFVVPLAQWHLRYKSFVFVWLISLWGGAANAQTPVSTYPYLEDAETGMTEWTFVNGTSTNQWVVGTATNNGGDNGLYISNNGGANNAYGNSSTVVHVYRDFSIPSDAVLITLNFDWKGVGESVHDYFRVWLVPTSYTPTAGTVIGATGTAPEGRIQLGNTYYNGQANYITANLTIPIAYAGNTFRLVFSWQNDGSVINSAAAIDNIMVNATACEVPTALVSSNVTPFGATFSWMASVSNPNSGYAWQVLSGSTVIDSGTTAAGVTTASTSALTPETTYTFRVRGMCSGGTDPSAWASSAAFTTPPTCLSPTAPIVSATTTGANFSWTASASNPADGYAWEVHDAGNGVVASGTTAAGVTTTSTSALTPNTIYTFRVRAVCEAGIDSSYWTSPSSFITLQIPVSSYPYLEDAETGMTEWAFVNGTQTNQWVAGIATNNGGEHALYISNNGGVNNAYSNGGGPVHVYRDFSIPSDAVLITLNFDWKGVGESVHDYFRVWLVPTSYTPTAGTVIGATGTAPEGRIQLGNTYYNGQANYITANLTIPIAYAGNTFRLVFTWQNDGSVINTAAAIDNIMVNYTGSCAAPTELAVSNFTATGADFSWTASAADPADGYQWEVRNAGNNVIDSGTTAAGVTTASSSALSVGVNYTLWVRSNCGGGVTGAWSTTAFIIDLIQGCTNAAACNYNPQAEADDGTCILQTTTLYADADGDGYGNPNNSTQNCGATADGYVANNTDCDDTDADIWHSSTLYIDADGDGYHGASEVICYGEEIPEGYTNTTLGSDCDDENNTVWAAAPPDLVSVSLPQAVICDNAAPLTLPDGSPAGGAWSGQSVTNGVFNPAGLSAGNHSITYTVAGDGQCLQTASVNANIIVDDCSGIEEASANQIRLYPTYTSGNVTVVGIGLTEAVIMDMNGKKLNTVSLNNTSVIEMQSYAAGIYFIHVSSRTASEMFKVVKVD